MGGWENINIAHYWNIEKALEKHRYEGKRFLIIYGAGHKGWFLRELRKRDDIKILEVNIRFPVMDELLTAAQDDGGRVAEKDRFMDFKVRTCEENQALVNRMRANMIRFFILSVFIGD